MPHSHSRPSRRSSRRRQILIAALTVTFALTVGAIAALVLHNQNVEPEPASVAAVPSDALGELTGGDLDQLPALDSGRPDYRYSVIPGGAYSSRELLDEIETDRVVAAHYTDLDRDQVRTEVVARDRYVHVSYRKGDQIFWTKNKVLLRQGETILTDGETQIRARCGNCIAEQPLGPTSEEEPDVVEFDRLVTDPLAPRGGAPQVAAVSPMSPEELAAGTLRGGGPLGAGGGGASMPLASGRFSGTDDPLASATPSGGREPGSGPSDPGPNSPPGTVSQPPIPGGDDPMTPLEDITLVPPGPENPGPPPGNPPELPPPGGEPVNPVPVPEPGTLLLVGGGGVAALVRKLRARKR